MIIQTNQVSNIIQFLPRRLESCNPVLTMLHSLAAKIMFSVTLTLKCWTQNISVWLKSITTNKTSKLKLIMQKIQLLPMENTKGRSPRGSKLIEHFSMTMTPSAFKKIVKLLLSPCIVQRIFFPVALLGFPAEVSIPNFVHFPQKSHKL